MKVIYGVKVTMEAEQLQDGSQGVGSAGEKAQLEDMCLLPNRKNTATVLWTLV